MGYPTKPAFNTGAISQYLASGDEDKSFLEALIDDYAGGETRKQVQKDKRVKQYSSDFDTLKSIANIASSPDQINALEALGSSLVQGYQDDGMPLQATHVDMFLSNKKRDYEEFKKDYDLAYGILKDPSFIDEEHEWVELSDRVNSMTNEDGSKMYKGGTIEWLTNEFGRVNSITNNIKIRKEGNNKNFKYRGGGDLTHNEITEGIEKYEARLSSALEAAIGDGLITDEEAQIVMLGDKDRYTAARKEKIGKYKDEHRSLLNLRKELNKIKKEVPASFGKYEYNKETGKYERIKSTAPQDVQKKVDDVLADSGVALADDLHMSYHTDVDGANGNIDNLIQSINLGLDQVSKNYENWAGYPMETGFKASKLNGDLDLGDDYEGAEVDFTITGDTPEITNTIAKQFSVPAADTSIGYGKQEKELKETSRSQKARLQKEVFDISQEKDKIQEEVAAIVAEDKNISASDATGKALEKVYADKGIKFDTSLVKFESMLEHGKTDEFIDILKNKIDLSGNRINNIDFAMNTGKDRLKQLLANLKFPNPENAAERIGKLKLVEVNYGVNSKQYKQAHKNFVKAFASELKKNK